MRERPYFMTNKDWYYHDFEEFKYKLTKEAPKKAIKSYKEFYAEDNVKYGGLIINEQKGK